MHKLALPLAVAGATALAALTLATIAIAQPPPGVAARTQIPGQPTTPTAVTLPKMSAEVTGPGPMFDSAPSQIPGLDLAHFKYQTKEYFVSGTAAGKPYTTRVVVRRPMDDAKFSGLVLAESMHRAAPRTRSSSRLAYVMSSGHAAVEILTTRRSNSRTERQALRGVEDRGRPGERNPRASRRAREKRSRTRSASSKCGR